METLFKIEITKENIIEKFDYFMLVPLGKILNMKFASFDLIRKDLELKNHKLIEKNGVIGVMDYTNFYPYETLLKELKQAELVATITMSILKLKELSPGFGFYQMKEKTELQYWSEDYKQVWEIVYENEKWFLQRLKDIAQTPRDWGD